MSRFVPIFYFNDIPNRFANVEQKKTSKNVNVSGKTNDNYNVHNLTIWNSRN